MKWHDVIKVARDGTLAEVRALRCPECDGIMAIEFVETCLPHALYFDCLRCKLAVRWSGLGSAPSWVNEMGSKIETC